MLARLSIVLLAAGCARGTIALQEDGIDAPAAPATDAAPTADAPTTADAAPVGAAPALLLTEIVLAPSTAELIELANPGSAAVDLSNYYLSDAGVYFQLPGGVPTLDPADFIARFPLGASIPAHGVITVALDTVANFTTAYGVAPTYSLASGTITPIGTNGVPSLTNAGELVVLFRWDGQSDLVADVDMILVGVPTVANGLVDKSGAMVDGPDGDQVTTAYLPDARTLAPQPTAPAASRSTKRIATEAGHQLHNGTGNGIDGGDETSEDTTMTWDVAFTAPTPGAVPTILVQ